MARRAEVGTGDPHPVHREGQQAVHRQRQVVPPRLRRRADRLDRDVAGGGAHREPVTLIEQRIGRLEPVAQKRRVDAVNRGSAHPVVRLAPFVGGPGIAGPLLPDADPAGERDLLIAHQGAAVRAQVDVPDLVGPVRPEEVEQHAGMSHLCGQRAVEPTTAEAVDHHAHPHAGLRPLGQGVGERLRDRPAPPRVGQQVDRSRRLPDRVEHRGEDLVAVAQDVDLVAVSRGDAREPLEHPKVPAGLGVAFGIRGLAAGPGVACGIRGLAARGGHGWLSEWCVRMSAAYPSTAAPCSAPVNPGETRCAAASAVRHAVRRRGRPARARSGPTVAIAAIIAGCRPTMPAADTMTTSRSSAHAPRQ